MLQSTRSQEQKLPIQRSLLLKIACILLKQILIKRTKGSISSCLEQNNLKIINLFYKRSPENQTNFQVMLKYYISLVSNRDLGWFGEFLHEENSILL